MFWVVITGDGLRHRIYCFASSVGRVNRGPMYVAQDLASDII